MTVSNSTAPHSLVPISSPEVRNNEDGIERSTPISRAPTVMEQRADTHSPLPTPIETSLPNPTEEAPLQIEAMVEYEPNSQSLAPFFARKELTLPDPSKLDPTDPKLLGPNMDGGLVKLVESHLSLVSEETRQKVISLLTSIHRNDRRKAFSEYPNKRKIEYGKFCYKLGIALLHKNHNHRHVLHTFAQIGEECKARWEEDFDEEIAANPKSTEVALFAIEQAIEHRRSLVPIILSRFFQQYLEYTDDPEDPENEIKKQSFEQHIASPHYQVAAKVLLNQELNLGYPKDQVVNEHSIAFLPFRNQPDMWVSCVQQVLEEHLGLEQIMNNISQGFASMSESYQDLLLEKLVARYEALLAKNSISYHPNTSNVQHFLDQLEEANKLPEPMRWKKLLELRDTGYEYGLQVPVKTEEEIEAKLNMNIKRQAMVILLADFNELTYLTKVCTLDLSHHQELADSLQRLEKWKSQDHEVLATSWKDLPSVDTVTAFIEDHKRKIEEENSKLFKMDLTHPQGRKRALSTFAVRLLLAAAGDLSTQGFDSFQSSALSAFRWDCLPLVEQALAKGSSPSTVLQEFPKAYLTANVVEKLLKEDPTAAADIPEEYFYDLSIIGEWIADNPQLYVHLPSNLKQESALTTAAIDNSSTSESIISIVQHHPHLFKELRSEHRSDKSIIAIAIQFDPSNRNFVDSKLLDEVDKELATMRKATLRQIAKARSPFGYMQATCPRELVNDPDILLAAIGRDAKIINLVHPSLLANRDFARRLIGTQGALLEYFPAFKKDFEIVKIAVAQFGCALVHADPLLQDDPYTVEIAVKKHGIALQYAGPSCKKSTTLALDAIKEDETAYNFLDPILKNDPTFLQNAIEKNPLVKSLIPEDVLTSISKSPSKRPSEEQSGRDDFPLGSGTPP